MFSVPLFLSFWYVLDISYTIYRKPFLLCDMKILKTMGVKKIVLTYSVGVPDYKYVNEKSVFLLVFSKKIQCKVRLYVIFSLFFFRFNNVYSSEILNLSINLRNLQKIILFRRNLRFIHCHGLFHFERQTILQLSPSDWEALFFK